MRKLIIVIITAASTVASLVALAVPAGAASSDMTPLWVRHVHAYPGGISNGVRAALDPAVVSAQAAHLGTTISPKARATGPNVQMNSLDSQPPLPQNETAVAVSLDNPNVAVAAANDYVNGGNVVMRTLDGGRSWQTSYVVPQFVGSGAVCNGGDPAIAYSRRDHVFFMSQLCFFRNLPYSEVQIYVSRDNGLHWTPGRQAARAATNFDYQTLNVDNSIFNDKE